MKARFRTVPTRNKIVNHTAYPDVEVETIVRQQLADAEVSGVTVTIRHTKGHYAHGWWRSYWYPDKGEDRPQILVRLPKPGVEIGDYVPYRRKREEGRRFPLADWREALVSTVAHEIEHHRQYESGERRGKRGSGSRRSQVEVRCDLAAYRAWRRWRGEA